MKIIDLLNKIANDEEIPKTIKYQNKIFQWYGWTNDIYDYVYSGCEGLLNDGTYNLFAILNQEVEIIEEEKKIPEKLNLDTDELRGKETPRAIDYLIESKINQVIDYFKSKGE